MNHICCPPTDYSECWGNKASGTQEQNVTDGEDPNDDTADGETTDGETTDSEDTEDVPSGPKHARYGE